jgi:hypothetical protein
VTAPAPLSPPARVAAYLTALLGLGLLAAGISGFARAHPPALALTVALIITGAVDLALGWFLLRRSRLAWAFAASLNGTNALVFLFGSFKLRDVIGIPLAVAGVPFVLFGAVAVLLAVTWDEYEQR